MIPWEKLAEASVEGGGAMTLHRRGDEYVIRIDGRDLMSSRQHHSEEAMARLALERVGVAAPRVLIGGLGVGYTLAATLAAAGPAAQVVVAELVGAVIEWNRGVLGPLAGNPLDDQRVEVCEADVRDLIRAPVTLYDVILLDVDNGPEALTHASNDWLYGRAGLIAARDALNAGGVLCAWAAYEDPEFTRRLRRNGFDVEVQAVRSRGTRGSRHTVWIAQK